MRVSVVQSNYVPWSGFFNLIALSDVTVIYDSVQFTKNDWRNRNRLISTSGPIWLTIPVVTAGREGQRINEVEVSDHRWATKHWRTLSQNLAKLPYFSKYRTDWEARYIESSSERFLHDINMRFLQQLLSDSNISTPLVDDRTLDLSANTPTERLVHICRQIGATSYLTGPAGLNYLERGAFRAFGIELEVIQYSPELDHPSGTRTTFLQTLATAGPTVSTLFTSTCQRVP